MISDEGTGEIIPEPPTARLRVNRKEPLMTHLGTPSVRQRIFERIAAVRPSSKALWGKMNSHQMLCHLSDSFRLSIGARQATPVSGVIQRTALKWLALYVPIRWPRGASAPPEVEQGNGCALPRAFQRDRADLIQLVGIFSDPNRSFLWAPHPVFGRMSDREWLRWGYLHADHHLRQFGV